MSTNFVTNIPTPYRESMFHQLALRNKKKFAVFYMNKTEPNRSWSSSSEYNYKKDVYDIRIFQIRSIFLRFSIFYIYDVIKNGNHLILGASWNDLNVISICFLKRLKIIDNKITFWTEANYLTLGARKSSLLKRIFRRFILNSADSYFIIPGEMARISLRRWGVKDLPLVIFPNIPHASFFETPVLGNLNISNYLLRLIIVARLDESLKGVLNFIKSINYSNMKKIEIDIVGEGRDFCKLKNFISESNLSSKIILHGQLSQEDVKIKLLEADVFVLPSFSDPSPLVVIEACKLGKPLLLSINVGNHYEALEEGLNGYLFDPYSVLSINSAISKMIDNRDKIVSFGEASRKIADMNFNEKILFERIEGILN